MDELNPASGALIMLSVWPTVTWWSMLPTSLWLRPAKWFGNGILMTLTTTSATAHLMPSLHSTPLWLRCIVIFLCSTADPYCSYRSRLPLNDSSTSTTCKSNAASPYPWTFPSETIPIGDRTARWSSRVVCFKRHVLMFLYLWNSWWKSICSQSVCFLQQPTNDLGKWQWYARVGHLLWTYLGLQRNWEMRIGNIWMK